MNANEFKPLLPLLVTTTVNTATAAIAEIDTLVNGVQFRQANFFVFLGATDIALTALKVQETDTSGSGYTDIADTVFGAGGGNPVLPTATDDNKVYPITTTGKKRFQKLIITVGTGSVGAVLTVICILDQPQSASLSSILAVARGLTGQQVIET